MDTGSWRVGPATRLPAAGAVLPLGDEIMVVRTSGAVAAWVGTPSDTG